MAKLREAHSDLRPAQQGHRGDTEEAAYRKLNLAALISWIFDRLHRCSSRIWRARVRGGPLPWNEQGFTLAEVVAGIAILATAGVAFLGALQTYIFGILLLLMIDVGQNP